MNKSRLHAVSNLSRFLPRALSRATLCSVSALILASLVLALAPLTEPAGVLQCMLAASATLLGIAAVRTHHRNRSSAWALLASVALLACASATLLELITVDSRMLGGVWHATAWGSGAFAFAAALFVASRALHCLAVSPAQ